MVLVFLLGSLVSGNIVQAQVEVELENESLKIPSVCGQMSEVWTNWDRMPFVPAMANLATMREHLNNNNLYDSYKQLPKELDGKIVECNERSKIARTDNGTCNNLSEPVMGAKGVAFGRNVPLDEVVKKDQENLFFPNPIDISQNLLERDTFKPVPFLNFLVTSWLQFMNHDWFFHGKNSDKDPYEFYKYIEALKTLEEANSSNTNVSEKVSQILLMPRTQVDPILQTERDPKLPENKVYRNAVTHWWDGSQIYGSDSETLKGIRAYKDGKMKIEKTGFLPLVPFGQDKMIEGVGFQDNWWVGLSMLHHLFIMEHNSIAEMLKTSYPSWGDEKIYDTARLINAAVMAKIHTVEWTPAILPNKVLEVGMETNWSGAVNPKTLSIISKVIQEKDPQILLCEEDSNEISQNVSSLVGTALFQWLSQFGEKADYGLGSFGLHPILVGMVGEKTNTFNIPYTLTEEFVAVYRMHPLLPEELKVIDLNTGSEQEIVPLNETRHEKSIKLIEKHGLANLFYSFGLAHPGALALRNYPKFMTNLHVPENPSSETQTVDMAALDVLRDRERGVPRYNNFRRNINLKPIRKFEDLFVDENRPETYKNLESEENKNLLENLKRIYQNDVEKLDLLVGTLGEQIRPKYFGFGETAFQIFVLMATRRLQSDRFFTEDYTAEMYTQQGLDWIDKTNMKNVLLRHFPSLELPLKDVKNAFNPWTKVEKDNKK